MPSGLINHTGDVGFWVRAKNMEDLFNDACKAFMSLIVPLKKINPRRRVFFSLKAKDEVELLHNILSELLFYFETKKMVFSRYAVLDLEGYYLEMVAFGEVFSEIKHKVGMIPKAVTYHQLNIKEDECGYYTVRVIIDI